MFKSVLFSVAIFVSSVVGFMGETAAQMPSFAPVEMQTGLRAHIRYLHQQGPHGALRPLTSSSILHPGDRYGIEFTPLQDGFIYIFRVDLNDRITQLFPANDLKSISLGHQNPVRTQQRYCLLAPEQFFQATSASMPKHIYVLGSLQQDSVLEDYYRNMILEQVRQNSFRESIFQTELLRRIRQLKLSEVSPLVESEWLDQHSLNPPEIEEDIATFFDFHVPLDTNGNFPLRELKGPEDVTNDDPFEQLPKVSLFNLFVEGDSLISLESLPLLHEYGKAFEGALAEAVFLIASHSEKLSSSMDAWELSRQRAESVRTFFLAHYRIEAERLMIRPYGSTKPIVSNESAEDWQLNNRIELIRVK